MRQQSVGRDDGWMLRAGACEAQRQPPLGGLTILVTNHPVNGTTPKRKQGFYALVSKVTKGSVRGALSQGMGCLYHDREGCGVRQTCKV